MKRRRFAALAAVTILSGCSTTEDARPDGTQGTVAASVADVPGLDSDGIRDVDAFVDVQRTAVEESAHAFSLTESAEETYEDGFEAGEARARYDPSADRLLLRQWWRYPDGERSQQTELYTDGSAAVERTVVSEDESRFEQLSPSDVRDRYTSLHETVRDLLASLEFGELETEPDSTDGAYRIPVLGVRDVDGKAPFRALDSGHILLTDAGVVRSADLQGLVENREDPRTIHLAFELTGIGDTTVDEPGWFDDVPETTTSDGDGEGGSGDSADEGGDGGTTQTAVDAGPNTVVVGPIDENFVFDPETLRVEPGTTVRWVWASDHHNIKPEDQPSGADWDGFTEIEDAGTEYTHTFTVEGTYTYICEPYVALGMEGAIIVKES